MPVIRDDEHTDIVWSRVDAVVSLILENSRYLESKRNGELNEKVMEKFDVSERTAQRYVAMAKREVRRIGKENKEKAFLRAIRDREYLLGKTKKHDAKLALEIMKDRDKLFGLYSENVNHSGALTVKNVDMSRFTDLGLQRIAAGEPVEKVMLDPACILQNTGGADE